MGLFWTGSPTPTNSSPYDAMMVDRGPEPSWVFDAVFPWRDGPTACFGIAERADPLWPMGGQVYGDPVDVAGPTDNFLSQSYWEGDIQYCGSGDFQYAIRGFVLDSNGAGVGNAWVGLYRSVDEQFIRSSMSLDSSGQYEVRTDDNTTQYYLVVYRTSPDIEGTTVNTLTGS